MYLFWKPGDTDSYFSNYALEISPWWGNIFFGYYFSQAKDRIGLTTTFSPSLNEWYHVAYIRNTAKNQLQLIVHDKNRNLISSVEMNYSANETLLNSKDLIIAANLDGYMDEVRISNVVRNFINTGVNKTFENQVTNFYPNPAKEWITIKNTSGAYKIEITDLQGKILISRKLENLDERINISSLLDGIYLLKLVGDKGISISKLIVE